MIHKKAVDISDSGFIKWLSELSNKDTAIAGGKGASLAEMYNAKFPVPQAFIVTAQAFEHFIKISGLSGEIHSIIKSIDFEDTEELQKKSHEIRGLIERQKLPKEMENEILESYHILGSEEIDTRGVSQDALNILKHSYEPIFVSVRSSATAEDLADASFAGQQETFLNIKGDRNLLEHVKKCFSSLFTPRAIYYRHKKGFDKAEPLISVVVQNMIDSQKSGVIFSNDPVNTNDDIVIEAVFGLGEGIVSGKIKPDYYIVSKDLKIKEIKLADKKIAIVRTGSGQNEIVRLSNEKSKNQVLTNSQIIELAKYALKLEQHYKKPQDIEFAIDSEKTYIVQSRPITTLGTRKKSGVLSGNILLEGFGSSPGIATGVVKIIKHTSDLSKVKKGDVLVAEMTNPDMVVAMQKSAAIVTDEGGVTAHASIVSRELGIPCVVGTEKATSILKDGMKITVDGSNGKVYEGEISETHLAEVKPALNTSKVKLKLILDIPESAERALQSNIHHIGLMRLEGIIASFGKHPLQYEKENNLEEYSEMLRKGITKIAEHFKSVWIRTSDIRTDEFNSLKGAPRKEINPMLGLHGIRFSLKHPKILEAELFAIKKVAEKYPEKKFGVMIPQVILIEEIRGAKKYFNEHKTHNMDFGVMIETPAAVQIIEDICKEGVKFVSFGTNDLTQFTLAVDRGEDEVQFLYDELNPAIYSQIKRVIGVCKNHRVETSICGQAGSKPEMAEFLFKKGINSISVNADAAHDISVLIKKLEEQTGIYEKHIKKEEKPELPRIKNETASNIKDISNIGDEEIEIVDELEKIEKIEKRMIEDLEKKDINKEPFVEKNIKENIELDKEYKPDEETDDFSVYDFEEEYK